MGLWTPWETESPTGGYLFSGCDPDRLEQLEENLPKWYDSLGSLFRGKPGGASDRELNDLASEAERASPGARWAVFNRLGDAYLKADDRTRALRYFGKSIDSLLEDDQPEPARAVAKKVIRLHPEAIRTLCTLTWLDLASMKLPEAKMSLATYVKAAKEGNREHLACSQVLEMARLIPNADFLREASKALDLLGCSSDSARVKVWATEGNPESAPVDKKRLHLLCLKAAIGSNVELKDKGALT